MPKELAIRFDGGWAKYREAVSWARFEPILRKHVGKATERNALSAVKQIRKEMKAGVPPRNAKLTITIKGGSGKPLVGTPGADLFSSATYSLESWDKAIAGVKRTSGNYNVALIVHEGATIKVTPKMRGMFDVLFRASRAHKEGRPIPKLTGRALAIWEASKKKRFYPLKPSTTVIRIPKRPYVRYAFQDLGLKRLVQEQWSTAVQKAFREIARKG